MSFNVLQYHSTKILTLAVAPVLFISVGVLCEFVMLPDVYILHIIKNVHIWQHIHQKDWTLCLLLYYYA